MGRYTERTPRSRRLPLIQHPTLRIAGPCLPRARDGRFTPAVSPGRRLTGGYPMAAVLDPCRGPRVRTALFALAGFFVFGSSAWAQAVVSVGAASSALSNAPATPTF